jgi:hypothetical protein
MVNIDSERILERRNIENENWIEERERENENWIKERERENDNDSGTYTIQIKGQTSKSKSLNSVIYKKHVKVYVGFCMCT